MRRGILLGLVAVLALATASPAFARRARFRRYSRPAPATVQAAPQANLQAAGDIVDQPLSPAQLENAARAIHEVRSKRGSVLDGTLLSTFQPQTPIAPDAEFFNAVAAAAGVSTTSFNIADESPQADAGSLKDLLSCESDELLHGRMQFPNSPVWISMLRAEARRLSEEAEEFEAANRFSTADGLRARADHLRRLAREYFPKRPEYLNFRCRDSFDDTTTFRED